jgi:hypothetical protein
MIYNNILGTIGRTPAPLSSASAAAFLVRGQPRMNTSQQATILIVSDHGFKTAKRTIRANAALRREGLVQGNGDQVTGGAYVIPEGGIAMAYVLNPENRTQVVPKMKEIFLALEGVARGQAKLADLQRPIAGFGDALAVQHLVFHFLIDAEPELDPPLPIAADVVSPIFTLLVHQTPPSTRQSYNATAFRSSCLWLFEPHYPRFWGWLVLKLIRSLILSSYSYLRSRVYGYLPRCYPPAQAPCYNEKLHTNA